MLLMNVGFQPLGSRVALPWGPIATYVGVVKRLPFVAQFEAVHTMYRGKNLASEEKAAGFIYRGSAGRRRHEIRGGGTDSRASQLIMIIDLPSRKTTVLDVGSKTAVTFTDIGPQPGAEVPTEGWAYRGMWSLGEAPEERVIEGVACRKALPVPSAAVGGMREAAGEIWVSDEIKYSVLEHVTEPARKHRWRLFDIRRVEPPPSLFVIPAGYREIMRSKYEKPPTGQ